jgi:hypothetical protein
LDGSGESGKGVVRRTTMRGAVRNPDHAILEQPWEYRIAELRYVVETPAHEGFIELLLKKGSELRRLRFSSPRGFSVDEGFEPESYIGLQIVDVSGRQLEGVGVEVSCFENTPGLRFFARGVESV